MCEDEVVWAHSHPFARCDLVRVKLEKVHELFQVCAKGVATIYGSLCNKRRPNLR